MKKIWMFLIIGLLSCSPVQNLKSIYIEKPIQSTPYDSLMCLILKVPQNARYMIIQIFTESKEYGFNPYYILSIIKQESKFDSNAVSKKGALGLMQLRPQFFNTFNTKENITEGIKHLRWCFTKSKNDTSLALASYNFGRKNALTKKWPKEARDYIIKIQNNYKEYKNKNINF